MMDIEIFMVGNQLKNSLTQYVRFSALEKSNSQTYILLLANLDVIPR